jgi:hypothetical protein
MSVPVASWKWGGALIAAFAIVAYLRDPGWLGGVTSGFGRSERDGGGVRFRWMGGRASFFVPAAATQVDIPLSAPFALPSAPFVIDVRVDDVRAAQVVLSREGWMTVTVTILPRPTSRRFRRVDLRANRTWSERSLSVEVGDVVAKQPYVLNR